MHIKTHHELPLGRTEPLTGVKMSELIIPPTAGGRTKISKKLFLTLLVILQVSFISCLWLLQVGGGLNTNINEVTVMNDGNTNAVAIKSRAAVLHGMSRVNFITKTTAFGSDGSSTRNKVLQYELTKSVMENSQSGKFNNFRKDFYLKTKRLNKTVDLTNETGLQPELENEVLWCFREGSIPQLPQLSKDDIAVFEEEAEPQCKCRSGWHGHDCGQPEIIWRALLTAKSRFQLQQPSKTLDYNRLVYFLEGNFFNLDFLDLQISTLADIVDFFVIFVRPPRKDLKTLDHWLRENLKANKYLLILCDNPHMTKEANCTTAQAYAYFRQQLNHKQLSLELKPTDLLLHTNDRVLPSRQALQYLKYYATDVRNIPFRLKYVVYGFYWQHPKQTLLNGLISSFVHADDPSQIEGSDSNAAKIVQRILRGSSLSPPFIIGDLNHFGGWFCKYCQLPEEIVAELHAESNSSRQVQFPIAVRSRNIDVAYLQELMANGVYVDGKTQLLRNHRYSDKYYAPAMAEAEKSKYGNLLVNLYESFNDDIEYEAGDY